MINEFNEKYPEIDPQIQKQREEFLERTLEEFDELRTEDWILNNEAERYESDEEGAL
jgi:hypothetical protein